jgi:hypothetical protein
MLQRTSIVPPYDATLRVHFPQTNTRPIASDTIVVTFSAITSCHKGWQTHITVPKTIVRQNGNECLATQLFITDGTHDTHMAHAPMPELVISDSSTYDADRTYVFHTDPKRQHSLTIYPETGITPLS